MSGVLPLIPKWLEPLVQKTVDAVVALFERHPVRIAIAGVLLVGAAITGNFYIDRTRQYQDIVSTTVRAETEDTPQRFKVLEAFIMSTIAPGLSEAIKKAEISADFSSRLSDLHRALSAPALTNTSASAKGTFLSIPNYISQAKDLPSENAILTDDATDGYLFFPLKLMRTRWESAYEKIFEESKNASESPTLAQAVGQDIAIRDDITISRALLPVMKLFSQTPLFEGSELLSTRAADVRPVQTYYITKNGLNRIINNSPAVEQKVVYRNMFRATTFFPSRPYFVEAFRTIRSGELLDLKGPIGSSFYVSQPYLDIGGFGVVVTLARPVRYDNHSDAAICFDLRVPLENEISFTLKRRLESFSASPRLVTCTVGFRGRIECIPGESGDVGFPLINQLQENLSRTMAIGDLSAVVGNISILGNEPPPAGVSRASAFDLMTYPLEVVSGFNTRPIAFAIPLNAPRAMGQDALQAQFLISSLNLERFQQITSLIGLVSVSCLAAAFFVVLFSWQGEMKARRSYEDAFKTVDAVLYGAPTPYCRLNARDEIVDCNTAFCALLAMPADQQSVKALKGHTFESLLGQRSKGTYHDVQDRRRKGEEVQPYTLYFNRKDGTEVETRVTSGVIPGRTRRELPQTFGIVISSADAAVENEPSL